MVRWQCDCEYALEQNQIFNIYTYISQFYHTKVGLQDSNLQMACKLSEIKLI